MAQGQRQQPQNNRDGGGKERGGAASKESRGAAGSEQTERPEGQRGAGQETRGGLSRGSSTDTARGSDLSSYGGLASPFGLMRRFMEDLDRIAGGNVSGLGSAWMPQVEMFREGDDVVIRADVPGMREEDIDIEIEDDVLTISGERRSEGREEREGFFRSERSYGWFERSIRLPEGTDPEKIDARLEGGVLQLRMNAPMEERRARKIPISAKSEGEVSKKEESAKPESARGKHDTH
jgi:HSP20 family protein